MSNYFILIICLVFSLALTWLVRKVCIRRAWLSVAVGDRLKHAPTPRFGGIAIFAAFAIAIGVSGVFHHGRVVHLLMPASGMFVVGLLDDMYQISPRLKLVAQIFLAIVPVAYGITIPISSLSWVNAAVTVFWFVGLTNAFNLLDNMNGLCAGIAIVVAIFRGLVALQQNDQTGLSLCIALAASTFGFLLFNFPKGLIFMGDSGALFLGFTLAGFAFTGTHAYLKSYLDLLVFPVLLMLVPICDTTFVTLVRVACGRPISQGGRDHLSHSLVAFGLSTSRAVAALWALAAACGAITFLSTIYGAETSGMLALILVAGLLATTASLARYQIGVSGATDLLARGTFLGIALTVLTDTLLCIGVLYGACVLGASNYAQGQHLFLNMILPVTTLKVASMAVMGCYPRLSRVRVRRVVRVCLANAIGGMFLVAHGISFPPEPTLMPAVLDLLLCPALIVALRSYYRAMERVCLAPLNVQQASHD